MVNTFGIFSA